MSSLKNKNLVLYNTTMMSLNERFTYLRQARNKEPKSLLNIRENNVTLINQNSKNQRFSTQMERRPAVLAALKLKKKSIRQQVNSIRGSNNRGFENFRRTGSRRGAGGGGGNPSRGNWSGRRGRGRGIQTKFRGNRSNSRGRDFSRSRSISQTNLSIRRNSRTNLNQWTGQTARVFRNTNFRGGNSIRASRGGTRGGRGRGRGGSFQITRGGRNQSRGSSRSGADNRGNNRGSRRGSARGRGGWQRKSIPPTKEELDMQLDQYMAGTKAQLDKELDSYMNQAPQESWD